MVGFGSYALMTPVFTRCYSPTDFAVFGILLSYVSTFAGIVCLRFDTAQVAAYDEEEGFGLIVGSLGVAVIISLLLGLIAQVFISKNILSFGVLPKWSFLVITSLLLLNGWQTSLRGMLVRRSEFRIIGKVIATQGIGRSLTTTAFGLLNVGWMGLCAGEFVGKVLGLRIQASVLVPFVRKHGVQYGYNSVRGVLMKYWKYPLISVPSTMIDAAAAALPIPIITHLFGLTAAGYFTLVQRLLAVPVSLIGTNVADVFHAQLARDARNEPVQMRKSFLIFAKRLTSIAVLPAAVCLIAGPTLTGPVFGSKWHEAGLIVAVLAPLMFVSLVVSPLSRSILVIHKPEIKLIYDVSAILATIVPLYLCKYLNRGIVEAMIWYSGAQVTAYMVYFAVCLHGVIAYQRAHSVNDVVGG